MSDSTNRKKVPRSIEAELMFLSDRKCCVDQKTRVQIHHIDGNPSNNRIQNLALLCLDCHDDATKTGGNSKKLSPETIKKYREHHYKVIESQRNASIKKVTRNTSKPTYADTLNASIQGSVLVEIAKIKDEYFQSIKMDRNDILVKLTAFRDYNFPRVCFDLFEFLDQVTYETRSGLPLEMIRTITYLVEEYFPPNGEKLTKSQIVETGKLAVRIAYGIIYDTSIHSHKYYSMLEGYQLLLFIYVTSGNIENKEVRKIAKESLDEIEGQLNRPERDDLGHAESMLAVYKEQFKKNTLRTPDFGIELWNLIRTEK